MSCGSKNQFESFAVAATNPIKALQSEHGIALLTTLEVR